MGTDMDLMQHIEILRHFSLDVILSICVYAEISNKNKRDMPVEDALQKSLDDLKERVIALTVDDLDKAIQNLKER